MRYVPRIAVAALLALLLTACHPGPVIDTDPPRQVGGTIAGIVRAVGDTPLPTRKVTAVETSNGMRYEATTASNGGFTIQVPTGTYRLEVELREREVLTKKPDDTRVNNGDLDPGRDFEISVR